MGIGYRVVTSPPTTIAVWDSVVTPPEFQAHLERLRADPEAAGSALFLTDLTTFAPPAPGAIESAAGGFAQQLASRSHTVRWAIVADAVFWDAVDFEKLVAGEVKDIVVFNDLETACRWLGIDLADARAIVDDLRSQIRARDAGTVSPS